MHRPATIAAFAAAAMLGAHAQADQLLLNSVSDNTLIEDPVGAYSCGAAQYFFAGRVGVNGGSTLRRGALRFDFSSIPPGSTVTSVTLRMYCSAVGLTGNYPIALKRFTKSWGEGPSVAFGGGGADSLPPDVTWIHRFYPNTPWATAGGEFVSTASATRNVANVGYYTWATTPALVADVQGWINNPSTNFGWCVQGNEVTLQSVKRFDSRESGSAAARPLLTVVFTPPANPADLSGDGRVDAADLSLLLNAWGTAGPGDINSSGLVDAADLTAMLAAWTG